MPDRAEQALNAFNEVVGQSFFPRYLEPFAPERIIEVGPPSDAVAGDPDVEAAEASVLKVRGENDCGRGVEGTGFLYPEPVDDQRARGRRGRRADRARRGGGGVSEVVYYNSDLDVAVLSVDGVDRLPPLRQGRRAAPAVGGARLPQRRPVQRPGGPDPREQRLRSPDIYGDGTVREVFSIRPWSAPGNCARRSPRTAPCSA